MCRGGDRRARRATPGEVFFLFFSVLSASFFMIFPLSVPPTAVVYVRRVRGVSGVSACVCLQSFRSWWFWWLCDAICRRAEGRPR